MSGRVYERKFDWDEARRLRSSGIPVTDIAQQLGVSTAAIYHVTTPGSYARMRTTSAEWQRTHWKASRYKGTCVDCGAQCRTVSKRCRECHLARVTKPAVDSAGRVFCTSCEKWLSSALFAFDSRKSERGFRRLYCRECETAARRAYRDRHKVPCVGCGAPALPLNEKRTNGGREPRCRACFHAWQAEFMREPEQRELQRQRALARMGR